MSGKDERLYRAFFDAWDFFGPDQHAGQRFRRELDALIRACGGEPPDIDARPDPKESDDA